VPLRLWWDGTGVTRRISSAETGAHPSCIPEPVDALEVLDVLGYLKRPKYKKSWTLGPLNASAPQRDTKPLDCTKRAIWFKRSVLNRYLHFLGQQPHDQVLSGNLWWCYGHWEHSHGCSPMAIKQFRAFRDSFEKATIQPILSHAHIDLAAMLVFVEI
jgi:hypothetical protein